jgi:plasmid stability protein
VPNAQKNLCIELEQFLHNFGQLNSAIMIAMEAVLAQLLVRNLEDQLKVRLQRRAKSHGHSMEAEARDILRNALLVEEVTAGGLGTEIANMFRGIGLREGEEIAEIHDFKMEIPDFES